MTRVMSRSLKIGGEASTLENHHGQVPSRAQQPTLSDGQVDVSIQL